MEEMSQGVMEKYPDLFGDDTEDYTRCKIMWSNWTPRSEKL